MTAPLTVLWPELLPVVAMAIRVEHGPGCPLLADRRRVAALLDRAADPDHPEHGNAVAAATAFLETRDPAGAAGLTPKRVTT